jgi:hypothetical protein
MQPFNARLSIVIGLSSERVSHNCASGSPSPQIILSLQCSLTNKYLALTCTPLYIETSGSPATMISTQNLRAVPRGPWTKPLDFNLHYTVHGEPCVPFKLYVKPELTGSSCSAFPQFCLLPVEIQLRVIYFCDSSTLFQLMQTSSIMRAEAKKLFWSYPNAWYCVDGTWLYDAGYTGDTEHDIDFLACVKQLDVSLEYLGPEHWMEGI